MQRGSASSDRDFYVRTVTVGGQRIVLAPFIRAAWVTRDAGYRQRRSLVTVALIVATVAATALSVVFVIGLARSGTFPAIAFATGYGLLLPLGIRTGRRWLARAPARPRWTHEGGGFLVGATLFVFLPVLAGFGLAIVPALFQHDFPGEQRARELTRRLAGSQSRP